jgi:ABC-2 type transport system ATP-binding protein
MKAPDPRAMRLIEAISLSKDFVRLKPRRGSGRYLLDWWCPRSQQVLAVDNLSFVIQPGEIVGYLGPNGAGKSTTIKMMSGILRPTSGSVRIGGYSPVTHRIEVVRQLGVVFGQRSQLYWDLNLTESFQLLKRIYRIPENTFQKNMSWMCSALRLHPLLERPVRQLSLGERMRAELASAMLHSPSILFLDEPTIGLDFEAKEAMRSFIYELNQTRGTTVILTTHDLEDVERLCQRLIIINKGKIAADGKMDDLLTRYARCKTVRIEFREPFDEKWNLVGTEILQRDAYSMTIRVHPSKGDPALVICDLANKAAVRDISIKEPDIMEMLQTIYSES